MLAFVTSLRHPRNAADYGRVEELLRRTLGSLTAQTSDEYVVLVVGNQEPAFSLPERARFVPVDFPPPQAVDGPHADRARFVRDKGSKIGVGLLAAREAAPDHVMVVDADDFVHRDLAAFTARHRGHPGWVVDEGWVYSGARSVYRRQPAFHRTCGTCLVVPYDAYGVPDHLDETAGQDEVLAGYGDRLEHVLGAHRHAVEWFARHQGRVLEPLPFRGAVYHVDTGENHSGKRLRGLARPLDADFAARYGLAPVRRPAAALWSAVGPRAAVESALALGRRAAGPVVRRARRAVVRT
ncbi:MAG TPA: glycosyltransferase family A protein [Promicromonospora sp.]|nr:glycosyltransferase family A protein [Promicromonospora sp.]